MHSRSTQSASQTGPEMGPETRHKDLDASQHRTEDVEIKPTVGKSQSARVEMGQSQNTLRIAARNLGSSLTSPDWHLTCSPSVPERKGARNGSTQEQRGARQGSATGTGRRGANQTRHVCSTRDCANFIARPRRFDRRRRARQRGLKGFFMKLIWSGVESRIDLA